eukprot:2399180-Prymnesium_polylepis.1
MGAAALAARLGPLRRCSSPCCSSTSLPGWARCAAARRRDAPQHRGSVGARWLQRRVTVESQSESDQLREYSMRVNVDCDEMSL